MNSSVLQVESKPKPKINKRRKPSHTNTIVFIIDNTCAKLKSGGYAGNLQTHVCINY